MSYDYACKYCLDEIDPTASTDDIISPCDCKGSMNYVHKTCFSRVTRNSCEICKIDYPESTSTNGRQNLDDDVFRNYIETIINGFNGQGIDTQVNSINAYISTLFVIIYRSLLNSSFLNKCLVIVSFMMTWTFLKYLILGIYLVFIAHIILMYILNLILNDHSTNIIKNTTFTIGRYLQCGIVKFIYKNKVLISDIFSDPISLFLIFLEFRYFTESRNWWISYEILVLFNLFLFGYIFIKNDSIRALNNYINRNRREYFNRMSFQNTRIRILNALVSNAATTRNRHPRREADPRSRIRWTTGPDTRL